MFCRLKISNTIDETIYFITDQLLTHLHDVDVHAVEHFGVAIAADIDNEVIAIASLELIDYVKIEKSLGKESPLEDTAFPRYNVNQRLEKFMGE